MKGITCLQLSRYDNSTFPVWRVVQKRFKNEKFSYDDQNTFISLKRIKRTAQKIKFSIKNFFNKCDQIRNFLRIWSHLLMKSLMENFIFCACDDLGLNTITSLRYILTNLKLLWYIFCQSRALHFKLFVKPQWTLRQTLAQFPTLTLRDTFHAVWYHYCSPWKVVKF